MLDNIAMSYNIDVLAENYGNSITNALFYYSIALRHQNTVTVKSVNLFVIM